METVAAFVVLEVAELVVLAVVVVVACEVLELPGMQLTACGQLQT